MNGSRLRSAALQVCAVLITGALALVLPAHHLSHVHSGPHHAHASPNAPNSCGHHGLHSHKSHATCHDAPGQTKPHDAPHEPTDTHDCSLCVLQSSMDRPSAPAALVLSAPSHTAALSRADTPYTARHLAAPHSRGPPRAA